MKKIHVIILLSIFTLSIPTLALAQYGIYNPVSNTQSNEASQIAAQETEEIWCLKAWSPFINLNGCAAKAAYLFLSFCSWVLWIAAVFFNYIIDYTLNITGFINKVPIVDIGWSTFRDFANLFFVFIILYIAINTIVGNSSYGIKALLGKVIVTAILINFSLFFTKVVIDASNIFALQFYSKIIQDAEAQGGGSVDSYDSGISASIADAMGMSEIWGTGKAEQTTTGDASLPTGGKLGLNANNLIIVGFGGGIFVLITATVFFAGGLMLLFRTITLIFLMVLSPLAFVGGILPSTKGYAKEWWDKLFKNALYAPVYMALLYLVLSIILTKNSLRNGQGTFVDMFSGQTGFLETLVTFFVLNALMVGCILVANKLGAAGSGWATKTAAAATFGSAAWIGRNSIGRVADLAADRFKNSSLSTSFGGRMALGGLRKAGSSNFDIRSGIGKSLGLGEGVKGGFKESRETKQKTLEDYGKSLGKSKDGTDLKKAFAERHAGATTLGGLIQRGNKLAGANLMASAYDDSMKEHNEKIAEVLQEKKTLENNPAYQTWKRLKEKTTPLTPTEQAEYRKANSELANGTDFKVTTWDGQKKEFITNNKSTFFSAGGKNAIERMQEGLEMANKHRSTISDSKKPFKDTVKSSGLK